MNCLVTGGSGFIGSHVVDELLGASHHVRIFDMRKPKGRYGVYSGYDYYKGSLMDIDELRMALDDIDVVFHLAAVADVGVAIKHPKHTHDINVTGTINLLEAMRYNNTKRIVYASTVWVYSSVGLPMAIGEDNYLLPPKHIYTATKLTGEYYCQCYSELYGLEYTIFRYGIPYGPGHDRAVLFAFTKKVLNGEDIKIEGDGGQGRYFVYVKDLAMAHSMLLDNLEVTKNQIYNLEGNELITVKDVAMIVQDETGIKAPIEYTDARTADYIPIKAVSDKAKRDFGWEPTTDYVEGAKEFIKWYRTQKLL